MSERPSFALGALVEAVADRVPPDRPAVCCGDGVTTWSELRARARGFAGLLAEWGVGRRSADPEPLDSGHDHVGLMLDNGPEFLECTLGSSIAGATAVSVNTRYSAPEVAALLATLDVLVLVVSARLAATAAEAVAGLERPPRCLVAGAAAPSSSYEAALARAHPVAPGDVHEPRSSDRVVVCTGGTTGRPKGVLWRSDDFFVAALRGHELPPVTAAEAVELLLAAPPPRSLAPTPLVHFAAQAVALQALVRGGTVLLLPSDRSFDGRAFVDLAERRSATDGLIIGEATTRPIVAAIRERSPALDSLRSLIAGSTLLSAGTKAELLEQVPAVEIRDSMGSSETGMQAVAVARRERVEHTFSLLPGNAVVSTYGVPLADGEIGLLARMTNRSLGYYRDPQATAELWRDGPAGPYVSTGDSVRLEPDGSFALLGRGALVIDSGGHKIYAQEVETALARLPGVSDCLVVGAPSETWGREARALVVWEGAALSDEELRERLSATLARYKLPKRVLAVDALPRLNTGKPDYEAAARLVAG